MRTIIDIPAGDLRHLTELGQERGMSRAEIIRRAVTIFLTFHRKASDQAFGLWKDRSEDGLRYQQALSRRVGSMRPVFDTNILIDYLAGKQPAKDEIGHYQQPRISIITWIEVMVGANGKSEETRIRQFLNTFAIVPIDEQVAEAAVLLRREYRLKLPDALIWAAAKSRESLLITRNTRDYPADEPDIRVPYTL